MHKLRENMSYYDIVKSKTSKVPKLFVPEVIALLSHIL